MQIIRGLHNIKPSELGYVVTIGNYDGLHLGHQQVLNRVMAVGLEYNLPTMVIVFEPTPQEFFSSGMSSLRITSLQEKICLLNNSRIDFLLVLRFDQFLADISAADFFTKILIKALHARYIVVGDDFCFGCKRAGDVSFIREYAAKNKLTAEVIAAYLIARARVSSTAIRSFLEQGNLAAANKFLGRSYGVFGRVIHGGKVGSKLGFPTANVSMLNKTVPLFGVYVVKIYGIGASVLWGVANIGFRPTVAGSMKLLEVHLLDFNANIYGKKIYIEFLQFLRGEIKFDSLDALREQIARDVLSAKALVFF